MKSIFRTILLGTLLTLAPATAWAQYPALTYTHAAGAVTDISGGLYNYAVTACPPWVGFGRWGGFGTLPRETGGDGVWTTMDANPLNTGGRTEMSYALADANGFARAFATANTSSPCGVSTNGSTFMSALGIANALFYRRYTLGPDFFPRLSRIDLQWALQGSFSSLPSDSWSGYMGLRIWLVPEPPPSVSWPGSNGLTLVARDIQGHCYGPTCPPEALLVNRDGTIDVVAAFEAATGRAMTGGDSFIIVVVLDAWAQTCNAQPGCPVPVSTTDFSVSTYIKSNVEFTK